MDHYSAPYKPTVRLLSIRENTAQSLCLHIPSHRAFSSATNRKYLHAHVGPAPNTTFAGRGRRRDSQHRRRRIFWGRGRILQVELLCGMCAFCRQLGIRSPTDFGSKFNILYEEKILYLAQEPPHKADATARLKRVHSVFAHVLRLL